MTDQNIKAVVEAAIKTQIVAAFAQGPDLIEKLVEAALKEPVKTDQYSYNTRPYLDHIVGQTVRNAAEKAVREIFAEHESAIKEAVRARFSAEDMVASFSKALVDKAQEDWRIHVTFEAENKR